MKSLQALREARAAKAKEVRNLLDPAVTAYNAETQAKVDAIYAEIDLLDGQISRTERSLTLQDDLEARANDLQTEHGGSKDENAHRVVAARKAFVKALRLGAEKLTPEENAILLAGADGRPRSIRNVAEGTPATGGYLVPTILMPSLLIKLKAFGGMRLVANVLATAGGYPIAWATMDDTASTGELVAENVVASSGDLAFGQVTINAFKFSSKIVPVSLEVMQDSAADTESIVLDALAMRIARAQNTYFTLGTGVGQPQGAVVGASLGYTLPAGNTASITFDSLVNLYHALDPAYRQNDTCAFMMHDMTFKAVKQLKDTSGRPLWLPTTGPALPGDGGFDTLLGKKLVINQDMPQMAANSKSILFGDFSKYLIRDVMDVLILRFTDSAYASKAQVGFLGWARADGRLIDASNASIQYLANSVT